MPPPANPKIYHIVHVDRLPSIIADGHIWCDRAMVQIRKPGTVIGMDDIKRRRLESLLTSHPGLHVGDCAPFYFCPRSVMLYLIHMANHPNLAYRDGQKPILHLEADLHEVVAWAVREGRRWAFTLSNAGSSYFQDRCELSQLNEIDWSAVAATDWRACKEEKQAEFLVERSLPWDLVERIGVFSSTIHGEVRRALHEVAHQPRVEIVRSWYY